MKSRLSTKIGLIILSLSLLPIQAHAGKMDTPDCYNSNLPLNQFQLDEVFGSKEAFTDQGIEGNQQLRLQTQIEKNLAVHAQARSLIFDKEYQRLFLEPWMSFLLEGKNEEAAQMAEKVEEQAI